MQIQASLERDLDFSEVEDHNSHCPGRGLFYPPMRVDSIQTDMDRWRN